MLTYIVSVATIGIIAMILVLGINLQLGVAGELNLSYYAFVALGAYMTAVSSLPKAPGGGYTYILGLNLPFLPSLVIGILTCTIVSLIIGAVMLYRLNDDFLAIGTLAAAIIFATVANQQAALFGGLSGVYGLTEPFNNYLNLDPTAYSVFFLGICVFVLLVTYTAVELISKSPFGRALRTVREDQVAATAYGYNVYLLRLRAFVFGNSIAGLGGGLLVYYVTTFDPRAWAPLEVVLLLAATLIGGAGNNRGVLVGSLLVATIFPQVVLHLPNVGGNIAISGPLRNIVIGVAIIVVVFLRPQGIIRERKVNLTAESTAELDWRPAHAPPGRSRILQMFARGANNG